MKIITLYKAGAWWVNRDGFRFVVRREDTTAGCHTGRQFSPYMGTTYFARERGGGKKEKRSFRGCY